MVRDIFSLNFFDRIKGKMKFGLQFCTYELVCLLVKRGEWPNDDGKR